MLEVCFSRRRTAEKDTVEVKSRKRLIGASGRPFDTIKGNLPCAQRMVLETFRHAEERDGEEHSSQLPK